MGRRVMEWGRGRWSGGGGGGVGVNGLVYAMWGNMSGMGGVGGLPRPRISNQRGKLSCRRLEWDDVL